MKNNDIPEEIIINKKEKESNPQDKQKKMEKRLNTAMRFSQRKAAQIKLNNRLLDRMKGNKNIANAEDSLKATDGSSKKDNNLLGADNQVDPTKKNQPVQQKNVDLKKFMENKPK